MEAPMPRSISRIILIVLFIFTPFSPTGQAQETSTGTASSAVTLLLNEVSPWPFDGIPWVEIINASDVPVPLDGWTVSFLSGFSYTFPIRSDVLEPGALHLLRISGGNPILPNGDVCVLSDSGSPVDAIKWGYAPDVAGLEIPIGPSLFPPWGVITSDQLFSPDDVIFRIPDTWPPSSAQFIGSEFWDYRDGSAATPGRPNNPPGPFVMTPGDGARISSDINLMVLGLEWATELTFQVASDEEFSSIVFEETTNSNGVSIDDLPAGTYYWRVRGSDGPWSGSRSFTRTSYNIDEMIAAVQLGKNPSEKADRILAGVKSGGDSPEGLALLGEEELVASHVIGVDHQVQRKDTDLVCLDGCKMDGPASWEDPHTTTRRHSRMYCSRACLSMIASSAGCDLSQDRITYFIFQEEGNNNDDGREVGHLDDPFKDLGHDHGTLLTTTAYTLEWIYDQPHGTARRLRPVIGSWDDGDPSSMNTVREFLDDGRPVIRHIENHSTVVDGYAIIRNTGSDEEEVFVRVIDPGSDDNFQWLSFLSDDVWEFACPPPTGIPMRCDEPEIWMDSDVDMLMDFDEINRFETDPNAQDTDGDGVDDMTDMLGYLFNPDGSYNLRDRDYDADGSPKELDPDNDWPEDNGVDDGCEDMDMDGFFNEDAGETDCFLSMDDFTEFSRYCFNGHLQISVQVSLAAFPGATLYTEEMVTIDSSQPVSSRDFIYQHRWKLWSEGFTFPIPGGAITSHSFGEAEGLANIIMEVRDDGTYRIITDTDPRVNTYTITTTGPGMADRVATEDMYLYFANHHFEYVAPEARPLVDDFLNAAGKPNYFEGTVTRDDQGVRIEGTDMVEVSGWFEGINGFAERSWLIWINQGG